MDAPHEAQPDRLIELPKEALMFGELVTDRRTNQFQLKVAFVGGVIGAVVCVYIADDARALAALAGGIAGMIIGAFVSGLILVFRPLPPRSSRLVPIQEAGKRLKRLESQSRVVTPLAMVITAGLFVALMFAVVRQWPFDCELFMAIPVAIFLRGGLAGEINRTKRCLRDVLATHIATSDLDDLEQL